MEGRRWFIPRERVVLGAVVLLLTFGLFFRSFRGRVIASWDDVDDWKLPAAVAAAATVFAYSTLVAAAAVLQALAERSRTLAFSSGAPFRDGEFAAADGKVRALGKTLEAPFSGRRCVAYEYAVWLGEGSIPGKRRNPEAGRGWAGITGVALAPTAIETFRGPVRLLGWTPLAQRFETQWYETKEPDVRRRLKDLLRGRKFFRLTGVRGFQLVGRMFDLQEDDDGALRHDWLLDDAVKDAHASALISESVVSEGDRVGASGLWSEERGGLYGQVGRVGLELWRGDLRDRQRRLVLEPVGRFAFLALCTGGLLAGIGLVSKSPEEIAEVRRVQQAQKAAAAFADVIWKDLEATRAAIRAGIPVDRRDHYDNTLLMEAAHQRDARWVKMLLEEGASVHAENPRWGTALDQAIRSGVRGRDEVIALLKAAGARDFRVGGENGQPVSGAGGDVGDTIRRWYRAIVEGDLPALNREHVSGDLSDIDWELWRRIRPLDVEAVDGFENAEAATVTVRGRDPEGRARRWAYHLVRQPPSDWRIRYEWELE
jgi:hypothetical protein